MWKLHCALRKVFKLWGASISGDCTSMFSFCEVKNVCFLFFFFLNAPNVLENKAHCSIKWRQALQKNTRGEMSFYMCNSCKVHTVISGSWSRVTFVFCADSLRWVAAGGRPGLRQTWDSCGSIIMCPRWESAWDWKVSGLIWAPCWRSVSAEKWQVFLSHVWRRAAGSLLITVQCNHETVGPDGSMRPRRTRWFHSFPSTTPWSMKQTRSDLLLSLASTLLPTVH